MCKFSKSPIFLLVILTALPLCAYAETNADKCKKAVEENNINAGYTSCLQAADQGDTYSQLIMGSIYSQGPDDMKDKTKAYKMFKKAAEQGNKDAQSLLGSVYINGEGVEKNYSEGVKWFRKAAEQADKEANKPSSIKDSADVITWYLKEIDIDDYDKALEIIDNIQNKNKPEKSLIVKKIDILNHKKNSIIYSKENYSEDEAIKILNITEEEYNKLIKSDPKNAKNYFDVGEMFGQATYSLQKKRLSTNASYTLSGKIKDLGNKSIKYLTKAISLKSNDSEYFGTRADYYQIMNQNENALKDYTKAISLKPKESIYYSSRAYIYGEKAMYQKAISDMTNAIEYYNRADTNISKHSELLLYNSRALYYEMALVYEKALTDYKTVCELSDKKLGCDKIDKMTKNISRGKKWVNYSGNDDIQSYYDKTNIVKLDKSKYKVWVRNEQDSESMIKSMLSIGFDKNEVAKYNNYSYSIVYYTLDCKSREVGAYSLTEYDESNNVISSQNPEKVKMTPIVPDSFSESLSKAICK